MVADIFMNSKVEIFDEVNSKDEVIGKTHKAEAHTKGLIHRVAAIFVFDSNKNLIVQVHEDGGGILDHTVGGHVKAGETYDDGAQREMKEEIGLHLPLTKVSIHYSDETYTGSQYRHMYALYTANAPKGWVFKPNEEVKQLLSYPLEQVLRRMAEQPRDFTAGFLKCMQVYCKETNQVFPLDLSQYKIVRLKEA